MSVHAEGERKPPKKEPNANKLISRPTAFIRMTRDYSNPTRWEEGSLPSAPWRSLAKHCYWLFFFCRRDSHGTWRAEWVREWEAGGARGQVRERMTSCPSGPTCPGQPLHACGPTAWSIVRLHRQRYLRDLELSIRNSWVLWQHDYFAWLIYFCLTNSICSNNVY